MKVVKAISVVMAITFTILGALVYYVATAPQFDNQIESARQKIVYAFQSEEERGYKDMLVLLKLEVKQLKSENEGLQLNHKIQRAEIDILQTKLGKALVPQSSVKELVTDSYKTVREKTADMFEYLLGERRNTSVGPTVLISK